MKKTIPLCLWRCLLAMGLIACHKDNNHSPVTTVPPAGKVLLDTGIPPGMQLNTTLSTNATLIDLANVWYDTVAARYDVVTYKGVNPSGWVNNLSRSYIARRSTLNHTVAGSYIQIPGNDAFALFPIPGLHNFHIPKGVSDTIDCTRLDMVVTVTFPASPRYTFAQSQLYGYVDDYLDCRGKA